MQELHNRVAALCLERFEALPKSGKPKPNEWTVLSCIVLELGEDFKVVALGTGSKCIGRSKMSPKGDILNDSHAEVICRRSFLRFLYDHMRNESEFLTFDPSTKKYCVAGEAKFHFFTTHVPCGDAAIFPKDHSEDFGVALEEEYEVPRKICRIGDERDVFRTGAKCLADGEKRDRKEAGSRYHVVGAVRTKPGRGDPTLSVSCSDKLSRWCHLGVQGALLSLLLDKPIYFSTFTVAGKTPFSQDALERALYGRLGTVELKPPYSQRQVVVGQAESGFRCSKESDRQPSDCSVSWWEVNGNKGETVTSNFSSEVAVEGKRQGVTKKNVDKPSARLKICKLELFNSFGVICERRGMKLGQNCDIKTLSYKEVKKLAVDYNDNWESLRGSFKVWTTKDVHLLHFFIE